MVTVKHGFNSIYTDSIAQVFSSYPNGICRAWSRFNWNRFQSCRFSVAFHQTDSQWHFQRSSQQAISPWNSIDFLSAVFDSSPIVISIICWVTFLLPRKCREIMWAASWTSNNDVIAALKREIQILKIVIELFAVVFASFTVFQLLQNLHLIIRQFSESIIAQTQM